MGRLKSTEARAEPAAAGSLLGNPKAVCVLGLGTLELNIFRNRLVRHVPAARNEVATGPQVPTPELRPQPSVILEEMMRRLPFYRLHHPARREVGRGAQQQMHMVRPNVPLQHLDVIRSTDFPDQVSQLDAQI